MVGTLAPFTGYFLAFVVVRSVRRLSKSLDNQLSHFLFFTFFAFFHFFVHFHFYDFQTTTQLSVSFGGVPYRVLFVSRAPPTDLG